MRVSTLTGHPMPYRRIDEDLFTNEFFEFDHESVHNYMTERGLLLLEMRATKPLFSTSLTRRHLLMARRCLHYLLGEDVMPFVTIESLNRHNAAAGETVDALEHRAKAPPVCYAAANWNEHARLAEVGDVSMGDLVTILAKPPPDELVPLAMEIGIDSFKGLARYDGRDILLHHLHSRPGQNAGDNLR